MVWHLTTAVIIWPTTTPIVSITLWVVMALASSDVIVMVNVLVVFADQQSRVGSHVELSILMPDVAILN